MSELDGKVAVVTGGTGALGGAVVEALLQAGARAALVPYTDERGMAELAEQLGEARGRASGLSLDLTDEAAVQAAYQAFAQQHGGIDILVNVAGGFRGSGPVEDTFWSMWQQHLDLNLKTAVLSCKAAIPHMRNRAGAIVNVSSRSAVESGAKVAAYGVAKRGVIGLTEALAAELRDANITVNVVLPSVIDTPSNRESSPKADWSRWVQPREIALVIRFLVGPDARVISGATIPVYGRA